MSDGIDTRKVNWPAMGCEKCGNKDPTKLLFVTKRQTAPPHARKLVGSKCDACGHQWTGGVL